LILVIDSGNGGNDSIE